MQDLILKSLQLVFALVICAAVGSPQTAFSCIQHFMLKEHIYEDRCTVSSSMVADIPTYCLESRSAYASVYSTAGIGFAIAVLPALYATRYFGYFFTNICCCLALAAGSVVISDRPDDQWVTDRFQYGYAIIAMAAPFAIFNTVSTISNFPASRIAKLSLIVVFLSLVQLGPLIWLVFTWRFSENELLIRDLFKNLLWVPCIWLFATLILMLMSDAADEFQPANLLNDLKTHFSVVDSSDFAADESTDNTSGDDLLELFSINKLDDNFNGHRYPTFARAITSAPFIALFLNYLLHSVSVDLIFVSGEARTMYTEQMKIWKELTEWSPTVEACSVPLLFWLTSLLGSRVVSHLASASCIGLTILQMISTRSSWVIASWIVGTCQMILIWATTISVIKAIPVKYVSSVAVTFLTLAAISKLMVLPPVDASIEFDERLLGCDPFRLLIGCQIVVSLYTCYTVRKEAERENRYVLEIEARAAFSASP